MILEIKQIRAYLDKLNINYQYSGRDDLFIEGFCMLSELKADCITWIKDIKKYDFSKIDSGLNMLFITQYFDTKGLKNEYNIIECNNPKEIFFEILNQFFLEPKVPIIEPDSIIKTKQFGKGISIGHHCYIGKDVIIGNNVIINHNVVIECPAEIGDGTIISSGVIIGTDGYGYFQKDDGVNYKVPHFGGVKIGKNVEIGANTCIDRGTMGDTVIGNNVKIDNLCHIAHNVRIGDNVMITAQSMLAGSCDIGENTYIAPGALINRNHVGTNAFVGIGSVVIRNVPDNKTVFGVPAKVLKNKSDKF
jgi:UDP-3-O-[3-hydroxymyristoyl] glucosamine N-acyltransferase